MRIGGKKLSFTKKNYELREKVIGYKRLFYFVI